MQLADARHNLRIAQDYYHSAKLRAEFELINKAGGDPKSIASSDDLRRRMFDAAIDGDEECQRGQDNLRVAQHTVDRLEAELDSLIDARKERDLDLRERNIVVMENWDGQRAAIGISA